MNRGWYKEAPPRKNKLWELREKLNVFEMHRGRMTREDIAKKLGLTVIQVDNQIRLMKKFFMGCCSACGKKLKAKEKALAQKGAVNVLCLGCKEKIKEYKQKLRKIAISKNLCGTCYVKRVLPGRTVCPSCLSACHRRRYAKGLCGNCGERPIAKDKKSVCGVCAEKMKVISNKHRSLKVSH